MKYTWSLFSMAALHNRCGHYILQLWFLSFFFFPRLFSAVGDWMLPHFHTWCGLSANLECMSEICCMWLAENTWHKNYAKKCHLCTIAQVCRAMSLQRRHLSTVGKNTTAHKNVYIVYQPRRRPNIMQSLVDLHWSMSVQYWSQDAKPVKICWRVPNLSTDLSH